MTIRARLTIWNSAVLAASVLACGAAVHFIIFSKLVANIDEVLYDEAASHIDFGPQLESAKQAAGSEFGKLLLQLQTEIAKRPKDDPELDMVRRPPIRIFNTKRESLMSPKGGERDTYDNESFAQALLGRTTFRTTTRDGKPYRVISLPVKSDGTPTFVIQTLRPLGGVYSTMHSVDHALLQILPFALLVSICGGAFLTAHSLRPIGKLAQAVESIGPDSLDQRLPIESNDELARLAGGFNHMLGRLERSFENQRQFVADASHELRTPLTALKANTSLALSSSPNLGEYRKALESADEAADSMTQLVNDLLYLSKSEAKQAVGHLTSVNINQLIERACAGFETEARQKQVVLTIQADKSIGLFTHPESLVRVLANLISNALRHTDKGTVRVVANQNNEWITLQVIDTGSGIEDKHLPHLFERFYRVEEDRGRESGGFGLGLPICESIVEGLGGSIGITSEIGEGTTVTVTLPRTIPKT